MTTSITPRSRTARLARRAALGLAALSAASAPGLVAPGAAGAQVGWDQDLGGAIAETIAAGCSRDCVMQTYASSATPNRVDLFTRTLVPTRIYAWFSTTPSSAGSFQVASSLSLSQTHSVRAKDLQPGTQYYVQIQAVDAQGRSFTEAWVPFKTPRRQLTVRIEDLHVSHDSDMSGNAEMYLHARFRSYAGTWSFPNLVQDADWGEGPKDGFVRTFTIQDAPLSGVVDLMLADEDSCVPPAAFDSRDDGCYESGSQHTALQAIPEDAPYRTGTYYVQATGGVWWSAKVTWVSQLVS